MAVKPLLHLMRKPNAVKIDFLHEVTWKHSVEQPSWRDGKLTAHPIKSILSSQLLMELLWLVALLVCWERVRRGLQQWLSPPSSTAGRGQGGECCCDSRSFHPSSCLQKHQVCREMGSGACLCLPLLPLSWTPPGAQPLPCSCFKQNRYVCPPTH